jgi:glycosyltransferase involved in cell wall biosynthesis
MKIFLVITKSDLGGAQSVVVNIANLLVAKHDVTVIAGEGGQIWKQLDSRVRQIYLPYLLRKVGWRDIFVWGKLLMLYIKYRPDVVHLHSSKIGLLGRFAFPKRKVVYTVHGFDSIRVAFRTFLKLEKATSARVSRYFAVSNYDSRNLVVEGVCSKPITIYNGISDVSANKAPVEADILQGDTSFKVLCIARLAAPKRFDLFCDVAKSLPSVSFYWIGNSEEVKDVPSNVHMMGEIINASAMFKYADVCMLPSDFEGFPMSIIEAKACGIPAVASNVGGISEMLDGENGFVVKNTVEDFAEKICYYQNDKEAYAEACKKARTSYEQNFTSMKMVLEYEKIYTQISKL